jgi:hypothetical protein
MTPDPPITDSRTRAAIVDGPSNSITCSRCASARSHSSLGVEEPNAERYRNGPKK